MSERAEEPDWDAWRRWLDQLKSDDYNQRYLAETQLQQIDDPTILVLFAEELERAETHIIGRTFRSIVRLATSFGPQAAILLPDAFRLLHGERSYRRQELVFALAKACGQAGKDALIQTIDHRPASTDVCLRSHLSLLVPLEGDDIDETLQLLATSDEVETRLRAVEALGQRNRPENADFLFGLATSFGMPRLYDYFYQGERLQHAAAKALAQRGKEAHTLLPVLDSWMARGHMGDKRLAIELMGDIGTDEAIGHILRYLEPTEAPTKKNPNIPGKLQKSAARALKKLSSPALLDQVYELFSAGKVHAYAQRAMADAIVGMVTEGLDGSAGFAWVRTLLQGEPSERMWYLLCALVNAWQEDERPMLIDYIDNHIQHWDDQLRHVAYVWDDRARYWRHWWPAPPRSAPAPCWPLVRSLSVELAPKGLHTRSIITFLGSEAGSRLTRLSLHGMYLSEHRGHHFARLPFPRLQHLHFKTLSTNIHELQYIFQAPWLERLESFAIDGLHYGGTRHFSRDGTIYFRPPGETEFVPLTLETLAKDPRVARFNLSLEFR